MVEDERKVANFLKRGLEEEDYEVECAYDGERALELLRGSDYDLMVLDLMLPRVGGLEVVRRLREEGRDIPVLMLTAKDSTEDIVRGLDAGGDDYLTKPFAFTELLARVRALLRRRQREGLELRAGDLVLNLTTRRAKRGEREIELTAKEYALLELLMRNVNRVVTRTMIAERVWDYDFDPLTNIVDVYINHLRKKIDQGFDKKLIHTLRGVGYMLRV